MKITTLQASQLRIQISMIRRKASHAGRIGIRARGRWVGDDSVLADDTEYMVVQCDSELQIREALIKADQKKRPVVIITGMQEQDLGYDVLARFARQQLFSFDVWETIKAIFQARIIDPALFQKRWIALIILDNVPIQGYPVAPNAVLTAEMAWKIVLEELLEIRTPCPDIRDLLHWSLFSERTDVPARLPGEQQSDIRNWISQSAGLAGELIFDCAISGNGRDAVPVGLACEIAFNTRNESPEMLRNAGIRLENYTNRTAIPGETGNQWAEAALQVCGILADQGKNEVLRQVLNRLNQVLTDIGVADYLWLSSVSPEGFEQRLKRYGRKLLGILENRTESPLSELLDRAEDISDHQSAKTSSEQVERIRMSFRLLCWLQTVEKRPKKFACFAESAKSYAEESSFADWAREKLWQGEQSRSLGKAYGKLLELVARYRADENRQFAMMLADWTEADSAGEEVICVEDVLEKVVAKAAAKKPVLLIVMDGMSFSVFRELMDDLIQKENWIEYGADKTDWPKPVIAALPTITKVSRSSLLCGKLTVSDADGEVKGFSEAAPLVSVKSSARPVLFRKSDLAGIELAAGIRDKIASPKQRIIGVIINAIDNYAHKGDQVAFSWMLRNIPVLEKLLYVAKEAGRMVILTSDHGHVPERESEFRRNGPGERFREDDGNPSDDEITLKGSRVLEPSAGRFIAPWSEQVRYSGKRHGYHGGVTPQEVVIPIAVLGWHQSAEGWTPLPMQYPDWWDMTRMRMISALHQKPRTELVGKPAHLSQNLPLFESEEEKETEESSDWIEALSNSFVLRNQRNLHKKTAPSAEIFRSFLKLLDENRGIISRTVMARELRQHPLDTTRTIEAMQRLLNLDGYQIIAFDRASDKVMLNYALLQSQFEVVRQK